MTRKIINAFKAKSTLQAVWVNDSGEYHFAETKGFNNVITREDALDCEADFPEEEPIQELSAEDLAKVQGILLELTETKGQLATALMDKSNLEAELDEAKEYIAGLATKKNGQSSKK